ncbi:hypothetical protein MG293_001623 [Ovis ammon polii]|uniref:Uncharacterized protein n=1 Tax=Ovis ammon polii TaxID=230172 RepID=A0AAD4UMU5_OVIAM|nr:hypothetical protein MG293_001623 [Ovis ammon polii]
MWALPLGREDPLEESTASHAIFLPGELRQVCAGMADLSLREKEAAFPTLFSKQDVKVDARTVSVTQMKSHEFFRKFHGQRNLVGYSPWGHKRVRHNLANRQRQEGFLPREENGSFFFSSDYHSVFNLGDLLSEKSQNISIFASNVVDWSSSEYILNQAEQSTNSEVKNVDYSMAPGFSFYNMVKEFLQRGELTGYRHSETLVTFKMNRVCGFPRGERNRKVYYYLSEVAFLEQTWRISLDSPMVVERDMGLWLGTGILNSDALKTEEAVCWIFGDYYSLFADVLSGSKPPMLIRKNGDSCSAKVLKQEAIPQDVPLWVLTSCVLVRCGPEVDDQPKARTFVEYLLNAKGFPDSSVGKESTCNAEDPRSIPGSGRSSGERIGYPLQYSWASLVVQLKSHVKKHKDLSFHTSGCGNGGMLDPFEKDEKNSLGIISSPIEVFRVTAKLLPYGSCKGKKASVLATFSYSFSFSSPDDALVFLCTHTVDSGIRCHVTLISEVPSPPDLLSHVPIRNIVHYIQPAAITLELSKSFHANAVHPSNSLDPPGLDPGIELCNFSFFSITGQGIDLDYHDIEWFAFKMNSTTSQIFLLNSSCSTMKITLCGPDRSLLPLHSLRCCVSFSPVAVSGSHCLAVVHRLLVVVASPVVEHQALRVDYNGNILKNVVECVVGCDGIPVERNALAGAAGETPPPPTWFGSTSHFSTDGTAATLQNPKSDLKSNQAHKGNLMWYPQPFVIIDGIDLIPFSKCYLRYSFDLIPVLGRSPGEGNGIRLHYLCLENSMDRGAWQATVHGITKSRT